jgi:peptidoglycan-associated lipoprotein
MRQIRVIVPALAALAAAMPAGAQNGAAFEVGAFGQFVRTDAPWALKNGVGVGGRAGLFLFRRWELEADASVASLTNEPPRPSGSTTVQTYAGRITYNIPFGMSGRSHQLLLGVGAGGQSVGGHKDFSVSPGAGIRWTLGDVVALRFDGVVEDVLNPADPLFAFPPTGTIGRNPKAAYSTNVELRAGVSLMLGKHHEAPPPPPPVVAPAPAPRVNQDSIDQARRRDSINRANRMRQDSIDAANRRRADSLAAANAARERSIAAKREVLTQKVYFDFDKAELREDGRAKLDAMIPILQSSPDVRIRIEGNADERGSDEYNIALGMRRAQTAKKYLTDHGIAESRIDITSNGEEKPVCQEHDESCWAQNRRDEFVIVAGTILP